MLNCASLLHWHCPQARTWVKALRQTWTHCFKHTLRGVDPASTDARYHDTSRLLAVNQGLAATVRDLEGRVAGADSEYWRCVGLARLTTPAAADSKGRFRHAA